MGNNITLHKKDDTLVIGYAGHLTSENSQAVLSEIQELAAKEPHEHMELDLTDTEYLSSAGLRAILTLHKKEDLVITGVSPVVYEIFEITGFNRMMDIRRAVRKVSLANATCIGSGFFSEVYRLDDETIVKLFVKDSAEEDIRREIELDKYALQIGIPTAISFDLVEADGKEGIIYEMMNHGSLRDAIRDNPEKLDEYTDKYTALLKDLHSSFDTEKRLPDAKARLLHTLDKFRSLYSPGEFSAIYALTETIPESDSVLHGDCHVKNIMLHNNEPLLIDLDTLSRGDPVIELGSIYYSNVIFGEVYPGNPEEFLGFPQVNEVVSGLLHRYLAGCDEAEFSQDLERIRFIGYIQMLNHLVDYKQNEPENIRFVRGRLLEAASNCSTLRLSGIARTSEA